MTIANVTFKIQNACLAREFHARAKDIAFSHPIPAIINATTALCSAVLGFSFNEPPLVRHKIILFSSVVDSSETQRQRLSVSLSFFGFTFHVIEFDYVARDHNENNVLKKLLKQKLEEKLPIRVEETDTPVDSQDINTFFFARVNKVEHTHDCLTGNHRPTDKIIFQKTESNTCVQIVVFPTDMLNFDRTTVEPTGTLWRAMFFRARDFYFTGDIISLSIGGDKFLGRYEDLTVAELAQRANEIFQSHYFEHITGRMKTYVNNPDGYSGCFQEGCPPIFNYKVSEFNYKVSEEYEATNTEEPHVKKYFVSVGDFYQSVLNRPKDDYNAGIASTNVHAEEVLDLRNDKQFAPSTAIPTTTSQESANGILKAISDKKMRGAVDPELEKPIYLRDPTKNITKPCLAVSSNSVNIHKDSFKNILSKSRLVCRHVVDHDEYAGPEIQIIPYVTLVTSDGKSVLSYRRGLASQSDLVEQHSVGFGGHIDLNVWPVDEDMPSDQKFRFAAVTIADEILRELSEEIQYVPEHNTHEKLVDMLLGGFKEGSMLMFAPQCTSVKSDARHMGLNIVLRCEREYLEKLVEQAGEKDNVEDVCLLDIEDICDPEIRNSYFENWSRLCIIDLAILCRGGTKYTPDDVATALSYEQRVMAGEIKDTRAVSLFNAADPLVSDNLFHPPTRTFSMPEDSLDNQEDGDASQSRDGEIE